LRNLFARFPVKALVWFVLTVVSIFMMALGYVLFAFAEPKNISPQSLAAYLFIPESLRNVDVGSTCSPVSFSKRYQECGGICGVGYSVVWGTTREKADVIEKFDFEALKSKLEADEIDIHWDPKHPASTDKCVVVTLDSYRDFRN